MCDARASACGTRWAPTTISAAPPMSSGSTACEPSLPMMRPEPRLATMKLSEPHSLTLP